MLRRFHVFDVLFLFVLGRHLPFQAFNGRFKLTV
jgi:hypothetical protein